MEKTPLVSVVVARGRGRGCTGSSGPSGTRVIEARDDPSETVERIRAVLPGRILCLKEGGG